MGDKSAVSSTKTNVVGLFFVYSECWCSVVSYDIQRMYGLVIVQSS